VLSQNWEFKDALQFLLGENTIGKTQTRPLTHPYTGQLMYVHLSYSSAGAEISFGTSRKEAGQARLQPEKGVQIRSATFKSDDPTTILFLGDDGSVYKSNVEFDLHVENTRVTPLSKVTVLPLVQGETDPWKKIVGDALYALTRRTAVFVSRDTAKTWTIDTTGINGARPEDITVDTNHTAWLATREGLFTQHPDSNIWRLNPTFPASDNTCMSVFVDRQGRIFVGTLTSGSAYRSTDGGASWEAISGFQRQALAFCDDAFGNIYALTASAIFRAANGSPPWEEISDSIITFSSPESIPHSDHIINAISGDTLLYAATDYGVFISSDQGASWQYSTDEQLPASGFWGLVRSGEYRLVSTNLGVYRIRDGDSSFTKVFPSKGFIRAIRLQADSAGRTYATARFPSGKLNPNKLNYTSTDNGTTWFRDTLGIGQFDVTFDEDEYFVDAQGTQYLSNETIFCSKRQNEPWRADTMGLDVAGSGQITSVSLNNKKGVVYAVKTISPSVFELYERPAGDSLWLRVDASAFGSTRARISSDHEGNIILYTRSGMMSIYDGITWTPMSLPSGLAGSSYADLMSVNKNGVIWSTFLLSSNGTPKGLYNTEEGGTSWAYSGLDGEDIAYLSVIEDTTYAGIRRSGIFGFLAGDPATSVTTRSSSTVSTYELSQNYPNPFNPSTTISFSIPVRGMVTLKVFDVLGREVATLVEGQMNTGLHDVQFDASRLSSGVYIYRIRAGDFRASRKLLLMK
jgi:photosystem II stability/assembly factor-like uncharacterized protein